MPITRLCPNGSSPPAHRLSSYHPLAHEHLPAAGYIFVTMCHKMDDICTASFHTESLTKWPRMGDQEVMHGAPKTLAQDLGIDVP